MWQKYVVLMPHLIAYRVAMYIVTSKPKRRSVACGVVHAMMFLLVNKIHTVALVCITTIQEKCQRLYTENH
jgi:c-di-GMP-related signal transduction protein